jgi:hypothetical protein
VTCPGDGNWHFVNVGKKIRKDATGEVWFRIEYFPESPEQEVIYCDSAIAVVEKE